MIAKYVESCDPLSIVIWGPISQDNSFWEARSDRLPTPEEEKEVKKAISEISKFANKIWRATK